MLCCFRTALYVLNMGYTACLYRICPLDKVVSGALLCCIYILAAGVCEVQPSQSCSEALMQSACQPMSLLLGAQFVGG